MSELRSKVLCGHNKWEIEIDDNCAVKISYNYHPIYGQVSLHDMSYSEAEKIGNMFLNWVAAMKAIKNFNEGK